MLESNPRSYSLFKILRVFHWTPTKKQYEKIKVCELWCLKDLPFHHNLYIGSQDTHECTLNIGQGQRTCLECARK